MERLEELVAVYPTKRLGRSVSVQCTTSASGAAGDNVHGGCADVALMLRSSVSEAHKQRAGLKGAKPSRPAYRSGMLTDIR
jgi:hypothetical protein